MATFEHRLFGCPGYHRDSYLYDIQKSVSVKDDGPVPLFLDTNDIPPHQASVTLSDRTTL